MSNEFKRTITRRMESVQNELYDEFRNLYSKEDFIRKLHALEAAGNRSGRPSILAELYRMLEECDIIYEKGRESLYYRSLVEDAELPSFKEMESRFLNAIASVYESYPTPQEYMLRMVNTLSEDEQWKKDTLRVRILKQFIKYGNYLREAGDPQGGGSIGKYIRNIMKEKKITEEEALAYIDDSVFDVLKTATKKQKKRGEKGGTYGLLNLADVLAGGKFKAGGAIKESMYLFAIVYGMTFNPERKEQKDRLPGYEYDVEENLFRDYYANNLVWYMTEAYSGRHSDYEKPSGRGINYKNFAEMIYLYFISKDYEPTVKIRLATEMINKVKNDEEAKEVLQSPEADTRTQAVRKYTYVEDILSKSEEEFEQFIRENYNCSVKRKKQDNSNETNDLHVMEVELEQETAYKVYRELIGLLEEELEEEGMQLANCNYGLWFTDPSILELKEEYSGRFIRFLGEINRYLGHTVNEKSSNATFKEEHKELSVQKIDALYVTDAKVITRTDLLVAYYYYYNQLHDAEDRRGESFQEVFEEFKEGADEFLEAAFYQPLNGKNVFDVLLAFSAYARYGL